MSRPPRIEYPGAVYHVMARGNERRDVFRDDFDRQLYLSLLARCREKFAFRIYAYCLMSNHVHLALETADVPLSRIVLTLHGHYAQLFNRRHDRVGHLFQGRYKAFLVQKSSHLLTLVRYIHENPVRAGIVDVPDRYRWSSDTFYRRARRPPWLDTAVVLGILGPDRGSAHREYVAFMSREVTQPYEGLAAVGQLVKGDEEFARVAFETARIPEPARALSLDRIVDTVAAALGLTRDALQTRLRRRDVARARAIVAYIARTRARAPHSQTAVFFRRDPSTLIRDVARIEIELESDPALRELIGVIMARLDRNA
jgi:putative transposase